MRVLTMEQMGAVSGGNSKNDAPTLSSMLPLSSANQYCPAPRPIEREPGLGQVPPGLLGDGAALIITAVGSYLETKKKGK